MRVSVEPCSKSILGKNAMFTIKKIKKTAIQQLVRSFHQSLNVKKLVAPLATPESVKILELCDRCIKFHAELSEYKYIYIYIL